MIINIILSTLILFKEDPNYLDSALLYIRILNIISLFFIIIATGVMLYNTY